MLVVIFIISVLAGLITTGVQQARKTADLKATLIEMQNIMAACESFKNAWGDYPPTSLRHPSLNVKVNTVNEGNESLLAHLTTRKGGGPFHDEVADDRLSNTDADQLVAKDDKTVREVLDWTRGNSKLLEYTDMWGNPFVYLHHRDYRDTKKMLYLDVEGRTVQIEASKSTKTGTFQDSTTFQIWSFGPNRTNENGQGDDVVSWAN
jgi:type II secretory pathway pseudopilin PulG